MMDKVKTFFILSEEDQKQLKKKCFQVTPNVCFCDDFVVMLKSDGTISVSGNSKFNIRKWTNITKICSGSHHIVGLKSDGRVVAFGDNTCHQCDVLSWKNVQNIFAKDTLTVGITEDDEMLITGLSDTYSDEMKLIEKNEVKLSDFMKKTERDIKSLAKQIDEQYTVARRMTAKLNDVTKKIEDDIAKLSKQVNEQNVSQDKLKNSLSEIRKDADLLQKDVALHNKNIEDLRNGITETDKKANILSAEDTESNNTNEMKTEKESVSGLEQKIKQYDTKSIQSYIPLKDFWQQLQQEDIALYNKNIENLRNSITETDKTANILSTEDTESNNTNEMKTEKESVSDFEQEIKQYDTKAIQSYVPSNDFWQQLQKVCKKFVGDASADKYMSKSLIKKFGLKKEEVFLAYDPYFDVAVFLQGKYGFAISKSGIFTTNSDKILSSSFLEIALAKEILYKKQDTYCVFADDKLIINFYTDAIKKDKINYLINTIQKTVREDLLKYLASNAVKTAKNLEQLLDVKEQDEFDFNDDLQREYVKKLKKRMNDMDISKSFCYGCMKENNGEQICPHCGFDKSYEQTVPYLPLGTRLQNGNYIIGKKISSDSQGAKYIAYSNTMNSPVIINEFMPAGIGGRSKVSNNVVVKNGFDGQYNQLHEDFLKYYRNIERLRDLKAITPILDIFSENNTSYVVEETYVSIPFTEYLERRGGYIEWSVARPLFKPLVSAMSSLHETKTGHYAIAPSNLVVTEDGKLRLKDFAISDIRKSGGFFEPELIRGYSAPEQYQKNGVLDESTDVYGFTATLFYALTGNMPESADMRNPKGKLAIPKAVFKRLPQNIVTALSKGLQVSKYERIQTFEALNTCIAPSFVLPKNIFDTPFTYRANNSEVLLLEYTGNSSEVIIPSTVDEKAVKGLVGTFQNYKDLKSVTIPDSVNFIGERTFYGCRILRDIYIPDSVVSIADDAFSHCNMRLTIHGKKGSYAETYAKQKWLKFIETD